MSSMVEIKATIKRRAPWAVSIYSFFYWNLLIRPKWRRMGMNVFTEHYHANGWGSRESASGGGSTIEQTKAIRAALQRNESDHQVHTMLDIPCGDFNWMRTLELPVDYIGADIVEDIVANNKRSFWSERRSFMK